MRPIGIERRDIDSGRVDVSGIATGRRPPPVHPGEILHAEFLDPMGLSVTADTALRLGRYFGTSAAMWMNLQSAHDLDVADRTLGPQIEREVEPRVG